MLAAMDNQALLQHGPDSNAHNCFSVTNSYVMPVVFKKDRQVLAVDIFH